MGIEAKKVDFSKINEVKSGDSITPEHINAPLRASALAQSLATNQPNTENVDKVGTPSVEIETLSDGTKRLKFSNLKGEQGTSVEVDDYLDGNSINPVQNKVVTQELNRIEEIANEALNNTSNNVVDDALNENSTNPVQNKVIAKEIRQIEEYHSTVESRLSELEQGGGGGSGIIVDTELNPFSDNPVSNKAVTLGINNVEMGYDDLDYRVTALEESGGGGATKFYLHKVKLETENSYDEEQDILVESVIELSIFNSQSTRLTKDYFSALGQNLTRASLSSVFYIFKDEGGNNSISNETNHFQLWQSSETAYEVMSFDGLYKLGEIDFNNMNVYDNVIEL